jgi:predicted nucleotidyltransferase
MRLTEQEKNEIIRVVLAHDPKAEIYLFGSRVNDQLLGGDIDLLVLSEQASLNLKVEILMEIKMSLGEQKIDLRLLSASQAATDAFTQSIRPKALKLL